MIIQTREIGYRLQYQEVFEGLKKWKAAAEAKFPEINITLMYNLAGERPRLTIQTVYPTLADYERLDAAMDADEKISGLFNNLFENFVVPFKDQFYRVIT